MGNLIVFVLTTAISLGMIFGWVANIIALIGATHFTGMVVARTIGIFVFPLGAVLGWF